MNSKHMIMAPRDGAPMLVALLILVATPVCAEPYLATYEGMHCSSCHSHPSGGGLRNAYGNLFAQSELPARQLGDANASPWTGDVLEWLSVGANLRAEYRLIDTPGAETSSAFDVARGTVYVEASIIPNRLSLYLDQQVAPGSSLNREAYIRMNSADRKSHFIAGQFFLPYGLRLQDDTAFVRQFTGVNFTIPDRGVQAGYESGPWLTALSISNGSGGGSEIDKGKQFGFIANYVRSIWRTGISLNLNDASGGKRQMQNLHVGVKTGEVVWLAEADLIIDDLPSGGSRDGVAGLLEANWLFRRGHNLKLSYDYFDPDNDLSENHQVRYSLVWEHSPMQFLQSRVGARVYDGIPQVSSQNRDEFFAEIHGFF